MDVKRGVQRVGEVARGRVFKQAGDDHTVWGGSVNDLFMDPSGPWWPLGIHQTDANREQGRGKDEEEGGGGAGDGGGGCG